MTAEQADDAVEKEILNYLYDRPKLHDNTIQVSQEMVDAWELRLGHKVKTYRGYYLEVR